jgi:hypothetical protein
VLQRCDKANLQLNQGKCVLAQPQVQRLGCVLSKNGVSAVLAYRNFDITFILKMDASKIAVSAILSQVQDGEEKPLAYGSRQLNKAEQAYSASEAEMLALVLANRYFRCYLFGKQFVVTTDHSALEYLRTFSDTVEPHTVGARFYRRTRGWV